MSTLTCPLPSNINPLSPNGFLFNITKLPDVNFFSQQVNIPSVSLGAPEQGTPFLMVPLPGEMLTFGSLELQFIVDEDMKNYTAIFNWMKGLGFPHDYAQYTDFQKQDTMGFTRSELSKNMSDGVLQILNSSNNVISSIQFRDIFPVNLESLTFLSTSQDVQYLTGSATFRFSYYEFMTV